MATTAPATPPALPVIGRPVVVSGHELLVYAESHPLIDDMVRDIRGARSRVWLETYSIADDAAGGVVAAALIDRAQAGVDVRLLFDAAGSPGLSAAFCALLTTAGVKLHAYHTIWDALRRWAVLTVLNRRDHRKILVVDDRIAYFGGINIVDHGPTAVETGSLPPEQGWRDVHVRLSGPQAIDVAESFERSWRRAHRQPIPRRPRAYRRARLPRNGESIRFFDGGPGFKHSRAARVFSRIMALTQRRLVISMAYFLPTGRVLRALVRARHRGVSIVVLVPAASDVKLVEWATRFLYDRLLKRGVRIYERQERMLHSKAMVADREWTVVGSCNLDPRSMWINLEFLAVIRSQAFADEVLRMCAGELIHSRRIRARDAKRLTWSQRLLHRLAWSLRWWL